MSRNPQSDNLSGKAYADARLYRPTVEEAKAYYSRPGVQDEILEGMKRWHVRLEPGKGLKHRWFNVSDRSTLHRTLMDGLDRMSERRQLFPYLRIDGRRYSPTESWEPEHLWGRDFIIEKDGPNWRYCWDAMLPVLEILNRFGVHFWLKYSGHHSLHVVVPAENFPPVIGSIRLADVFPNVAWRLLAFFNVACCEPVMDHGFDGGTAGTNMPYSLNEHSGLLNYPVLETEIADFQPYFSDIHHAEVRSFWRSFPEKKRVGAKSFLRAALEFFGEESAEGDLVCQNPPLSFSELSAQMSSKNRRARRSAVAKLPWFRKREAGERVLFALNDRRFEVRKAAVKALVGIDHPDDKAALRRLANGGNPKLAQWAERVLALKLDVEAVLRELRTCQED